MLSAVGAPGPDGRWSALAPALVGKTAIGGEAHGLRYASSAPAAAPVTDAAVMGQQLMAGWEK